MQKKIRVLIVDDSSVIRTLLSKILSSDPNIEVVGTAIDPFIAREKIVELNPDVMTLDIEMPRMDGITFLEKVMKHKPIPTVVISSLSTRGSEMALRALEVGAVEVMAKPAIDVTKSMNEIGASIIDAVITASKANINAYARSALVNTTAQPVQKIHTEALGKTTHQILAIASSTGGTEALKVLLTKLPPNIPGTLIVQHIPPVFSKTFAESLNRMCPFEVKEAVDGDRVHPGRVLVAPGNYHMELTRSGAYYYVKLNQDPPVHAVRPAADILMRSVAKIAGANAIGVVLTGMGKDGAAGLLEMKKAGSYNIAQDEASCVVYGMPREAVELGAIHKILSLNQISNELVEQFAKREVA